jgi:hypothetical protein
MRMRFGLERWVFAFADMFHERGLFTQRAIFVDPQKP